MKTVKIFLAATFLAAFFALFLFSCSKDTTSSQTDVPAGSQRLHVYLTDDPALFDHVNIDIQSVKVLIDTCSNGDDNNCDDNGWHHGWEGDDDHHGNHNDSTDTCRVWFDLGATPGVYDLLGLSNGLDTLLANAVVPDGRVIKLKIQLGPNNSLVKDSVTYPLNLLPNQNSITITFRGHEWDEFDLHNRRIWLDFDVARSIFTFNGDFYLKPVIKVFVVRNTGSIEGKVSPREAFAVVSVYNGADTAYAIPNHGGEFKVRGLVAADDYTVFINASNSYVDTTLNNVSVQRRHETNLGHIVLHQ